MMEMNERLALFMRSEQLTAAKLAEIVQVQPSSISHLLSGRNKPNFDFVSRMLRMFSELNPDWLINGVGPMYRHNQAEESIKEPNTPIAPQTEPNLFEKQPEQQINQAVPFESFSDTIVTAQVSPPIQNSPIEPFLGEPLRAVDPAPEAPQSPKEPIEPIRASAATGTLVGVRQVVVLFDDQTCAVYQHR